MAPNAGGSWPLLGHLHLLGGPLPAHLVLARMADKYGPIFTISLGLRKAMVVNAWAVAKECLTTNDPALATRPKSVSSEVMTYNYAMIGFSLYGPYWRQLIGRYVLADGFRFMRWLDLGGYEKAMKRTAKKLDRVVQRWLDEHKGRWLLG
ncbi:hypothetical protein CDL15_Pgr006823 [Punica granatum]|uniref:Uncharacterized protein n=1 Tax=Punica granatum TaxID=22663 RepID=A0A218X7A5_PUNGR|nr:hypothetical protein CDL15_Pgr006823 [Punica granatum]